MQTVFSDMLYLLACAVNGKAAAQNRIEQMDLDALYILCKEHSVAALAATALGAGLKGNPQQASKWAQEQMKALYRDMNFAAERTAVLAFLEQNGIWYMPLKGIILREYYPRPELREFADNDILFDARFADRVEEWMLARGYRRKQSDSGQVMEYEKEPCFNFEMHRSLYHTNSSFYDYYQNVKERLMKDEGNLYGYHFSNEDFYIFMLSHMNKHYRSSGVGIRSLLDVYVFLHAVKALDDAYVQEQLQSLDCVSFEQQMRTLAEKVFGETPAPLTAQEESVLAYLFRSGTYGSEQVTMENRMKNLTGDADFSAKGRFKYWCKRMFSLEDYKSRYPRAYKTGIAIPFLILFRLIKGLFKPKTIYRENKHLKELEK